MKRKTELTFAVLLVAGSLFLMAGTGAFNVFIRNGSKTITQAITTDTLQVQNLRFQSSATAGHVLTLNSRGNVSAAAASGGSTFDPATTVDWMDDFIGGSISATTGLGDHFWTLFRSDGTETFGALASGQSTDNWGELAILPNNPSTIILYQANVEPLFNNGYFEARISVPSVAASQNISVGLGSSTTAVGTGAETDGVTFIVDIAVSANWIRSTCKDGTRTETASSTAVTTGYHTLKFVVNDGRTSIEFFVDGSSVGSNTTNLPTGAADVMHLKIGTNSSALGQVKIDMVRVNFAVTR